jgi:Phytanoyl-CoA dioxygenase (PhyH)
LARFNAQIEPVLAVTARGQSDMFNPFSTWFYGRQTLTITGLAGKSGVCATEVLTHPLYRALGDEILLPNCACCRLDVTQVLDRGPGAEQQLVHRDEAAWPHLFQPHPEVQVASVIALEAVTAANGATRVVPGSHRWPRDRVAEPDEVVAAEMAAGSAVGYLGWLHTEENRYLATPLDTVRSRPREAQALLGYAVHDGLAIGGGYLGAVELQDPLELLADGAL